MNSQSFHRVAEDLRREVEEFLTGIGVLCRVFGRGKSVSSLHQKLSKRPGKYGAAGKLIQDAVGLRVVLYFAEDIPIVEEVLKGRFQFDEASSTIDIPATDVFAVTRHNLIFKLPSRFDRDVALGRGSTPVDSTFEVQIRTLFSEGWHEVEHDLRYKRPSHWQGHEDLSRSFNGIVAALETSEWGMRTILNELAYRHYRNRDWEAMLCSSLRMRVHTTLSAEFKDVFDADQELAKRIFRVSRKKIFRTLASAAPRIPLTLDNLVSVWNYLEVNDARLTDLTPMFVKDAISSGEEGSRTE